MNKKSNKSGSFKKFAAYICAIMALCLIFSFGCFSKSDIAQKTQEESSTTNAGSASSETPAGKDIEESPSVESTPSTDAQMAENELRKNFDKLKNEETDPAKILIFLEENISAASKPLADEIAYFNFDASEGDLEKFTDNYADPEIQDAIYNEFNGSTDLEELKTSQNRKLAILAQKTIDRKYRLFNTEGFITPILDYKAYSEYRQYLSKEMNDYLDIMQSESDKPSISDMGIIITMDDFKSRIIASYAFVDNYPDSVRKPRVEDMRNGKLWIYLAGIDNTPVFDFNGAIIPERLRDFQDTDKKFDGTAFGKALKEYLDLLAIENYSYTQNVKDYLATVSSY